jgi:hypothetical protein
MTHRLHRLAKGLRQEVVTGGGVGCPSASRVQARRTSRPHTIAAPAIASQNSTTSRRRSVHQRSLLYWLPQAWARSIGQRRPGRPAGAARAPAVRSSITRPVSDGRRGLRPPG